MSPSRTIAVLAAVASAVVIGGFIARAAYFESIRSRIAVTHRAHTTLTIPGKTKEEILAGNADAIQWLESQLLSDSGSIPALVILAPRAGIDVGAIPDFVSGYGVCGNSSTHEIITGLRERLRDLEVAKANAVARYFTAHNKPLARYPEIDFQDRESVGFAFLTAVESGNLSLLYLLLENDDWPKEMFWQSFFRLQHYNPSMVWPIRKTGSRYDAYELGGDRGIRVYFESGYPLTICVSDSDKDGRLGISSFSFHEFQ